MFPNPRFVGMDLSEDAVAYARTEAGLAGDHHTAFIAADLGDFDRDVWSRTNSGVSRECRLSNVDRWLERDIQNNGYVVTR